MVRTLIATLVLLTLGSGPAWSQITREEIQEAFEGQWMARGPGEPSVFGLEVRDGRISLVTRCGKEVCESDPVPIDVYLNVETEDSLHALTATVRTDSAEMLVVATLLSPESLRIQTLTRSEQNGIEAGSWSESVLGQEVVLAYMAAEPVEFFLLPIFPLPAPRWTFQRDIPRSLGTTGGETFGVVYDRLERALIGAGVDQFGVYGIPQVNSDSIEGFAIVTRRERIDDTGKPANPRWGDERLPIELESFADFLSRLMDPGPGRYRVLVLITTAQWIQPTTEPPTGQQMENLLMSGGVRLPDELRPRRLRSSAHVTALIYEFYRASEDDEVRVLPTSQSDLSAIEHLVGAGLWREGLGGQNE